MKTLLPLLLISFLAACSPIDDRIVTSEFPEKMRKIQKINSEDFAPEDFENATQMMKVAILTGNDLVLQQRTYREYLTVLREARLEYNEDYRKYQAKLKEFQDTASKIDTELIEARHGYYDSDPITFRIRISNNSDRKIYKIAIKLLIGHGDKISGEKVFAHDKSLEPGEITRMKVSAYAREFNSRAWGSSFFDHDLYWAEIEYFDYQYRRMERPYPPKDPFEDIR